MTGKNAVIMIVTVVAIPNHKCSQFALGEIGHTGI